MNYNTLRNKPTINYRELIGDSTVSEVGGITEDQFDQLLDTDLASYYTKEQIDELFARSFIYKEKSGSIVTFDCPATTNGIAEVTSEIVAVQSGTGDPSPTNIRPITGWSAVNVTRDANIMPIDMRWENYYLINAQGEKVQNSEYKCAFDYIEVEPSTTYYIQVNYTRTGELAISVPFYADDKSFISRDVVTLFSTQGIQGGAFTTPANCHYIKASIPFSSTDPYLQYGSAYSGQTYTTTLKDSQGNPLECYGGELVNENGVQSLVNGRKKVKISDLTWNYNSTYGYFNATISDMTSQYTGASEITKTLCSIYKYKGADVSWANMGDLTFGINEQSFRIKDARYSTPEDFVQSVGNQEILYELATPQTIPQDNLAIASQDGTNNIWCDSGDITVKALDRIIQG